MLVYPTTSLPSPNADIRVSRILRAHLPPRQEIGLAFATKVQAHRKRGCTNAHEVHLCEGEMNRLNVGVLYMHCKARGQLHLERFSIQMNDITKVACVKEFLALDPPVIIGKKEREANAKLLKDLIPTAFRRKTDEILARRSSEVYQSPLHSDSDSDFEISTPQSGRLSKSSPAYKVSKGAIIPFARPKSSPLRKQTAEVETLKNTKGKTAAMRPKVTPRPAKRTTTTFSDLGSSSPPTPQTFLREFNAAMKPNSQLKAFASTSNSNVAAGPSKIPVIYVSSSDEEDDTLSSSPLVKKRKRSVAKDKETDKMAVKKERLGE